MSSLPVLSQRVPPIEIARRPRVMAALSGPIALAVAPVALGMALQVNYGQYDPLALRWLGVALLACFAAFRSLGGERQLFTTAADTRVLMQALSVGLVVQFALLLSTSPMATLVVRSARDLLPFQIGVALAAGFTAWALIGWRFQRWALLGLLTMHFLLGLWVLRVKPPPAVDVCVFQRDACRALLSGHNPYAITFPVPYDDPARIYAPGTFSGGRLLFGYPYPPLSLLLILPGYLLGDFRYAHLAAITLAGLLIALARPGRIATAAAALFLFTPRGFFVLEAGWTEPLAVLLLAAIVFAACRSRRSLPVALGLLLAAKQYLVLAMPFALLLKPPQRSARHFLYAAAPLPLLLSLPLVLWNVPAFLRSAVLLQFHQPMRMDALSYTPWLVTNMKLHLPVWFAFIMPGGAIAFVLRQRARTPAAFAAAVALVFFLFFAFNKQAFCNYYFFVIGAMCCALAACGLNECVRANRDQQSDLSTTPQKQRALFL